jgi:drug/metabolite transporter (DMT)-like permease
VRLQTRPPMFRPRFAFPVARPSAPVRAALLMTAQALIFAGMSAVIRYSTQNLHPFEVAFFRCLFGLVFMLPWLWRAGLAGLRTERLLLYGWRSAAGVISMLASFSALAMLPFAQAITLTFTTPLFATVGAALFLGEVVRRRRWTAAIVGFIGVVIVLRPDAAGLNLGIALALLSAMINAGTTLIVRNLARTEPASAIVTYMVLISTPMTLVPALFFWEWPSPDMWVWLVATGALGSLGHSCFSRALVLSEASAVMPYDYTRLVFAAVIGYFAFNELPTVWTFVGAAVIVASALYIANREARLNQTAALRATAQSETPR